MSDYPKEIVERDERDLKLGIKSSLSHPPALISLVYVLWKSNGCPNKLKYSEVSPDDSTKILLKSEYIENICNLFKDEINSFLGGDKEVLKKTASQNPLLTAQIESLIVTLELFWKTAKIEFIDQTKSFSAERTAGERYEKALFFTANIDVLDMVISNKDLEITDDAKKILFYWLFDANKELLSSTPSIDQNTLQRILLLLTIFSEDAVFKVRPIDQSNELIFRQEGIYSKIDDTSAAVDTRDRREPVGPFRVLKSSIKSNLHAFLFSDDISFKLKDGTTYEFFDKYRKRVANFLDLISKKTIINIEQEPEYVTKEAEELQEDYYYLKVDIPSQIPRNRIIYGAPGTRKSHQLWEEVEKKYFPDERLRAHITFHPDYSYSQFVGTYKPTPIYEKTDRELLDTDMVTPFHKKVSPLIDYRFVPGPFLEMLCKAIKKPVLNFVLVIDEINRADVAAVFGDTFQLLDRDADGQGQYTIKFGNDAMQYLASNGIHSREVKLPTNLFLWATMNSADQGVMPMDAAFKRRWSFEYLPLDRYEKIYENNEIKLNFLPEPIKWNKFRKIINKHLVESGVSEDRLLGPFFLRDYELKDSDAFKNKVLLYLRDDVLRHNPESLFEGKSTFSAIVEDYDNGKKIFKIENNKFLD